MYISLTTANNIFLHLSFFVLNSAIGSGMTWSDIEDMVAAEKNAGACRNGLLVGCFVGHHLFACW